MFRSLLDGKDEWKVVLREHFMPMAVGIAMKFGVPAESVLVLAISTYLKNKYRSKFQEIRHEFFHHYTNVMTSVKSVEDFVNHFDKVYSDYKNPKLPLLCYF